MVVAETIVVFNATQARMDRDVYFNGEKTTFPVVPCRMCDMRGIPVQFSTKNCAECTITRILSIP